MNTIQKLMLALLMLGSMPGALLAMDADTILADPVIVPAGDPNPEAGADLSDGEALADEQNYEDESDDDEGKFVDAEEGEEDPVPEPATTPGAAPGPTPAPTSPAIPDAVVPLPSVVVVTSPNVSTPAVIEILSEKMQSLMTKRVLVGLTGIILAMTGLRYVYVSSVIKQVADLQSLRTHCDALLKAVLKGQTDPQLVEVDFITCFGLTQELQDKLDDAVSAYNIALQQVCHELCADQGGPLANRIQVQQAHKAMALCNQVIDECEQLLIKEPTVVDAMIKKGCLLTRAFTAQVKTTTTVIAHKFKRSAVKKA